MVTIHNGVTLRQIREKLLVKGVESLSDAELLAVFLQTSAQGKTSLDISRALLRKLGTLRQIMAANPKDFTATLGLGITKYVQLQAAKELIQRCLEESLYRGQAMENPQIVQRYLNAKLRLYPYEVFSCLFLDNQHRLILFKELFYGSINEAPIYPRELLRYVYQTNAAAVILAHNHPSGVAKPSEADKRITKQINVLLSAIGVRLIDHIIIGAGQFTSFAQQGLL